MQALFTVFLLFVWNIVYGQIRYAIHEELKHGAFVGNIAQDLGLDVRQLSGRRLRIMSAVRKRYFEINLKNGVLFVNEMIDREHICGQSPACFMNLEVVVENPLELYRIEVEILDINDNSPSFPSAEISLEVLESAPPRTRFLLQSAHDPDLGINSVRIYYLSPNEHFALEVQNSGDDSKFVHLLLQKYLDREQQASHHLLLTAADGGTPERTGTTQVIVTVLDVNDNSPVFGQTLYKSSLMENVPIGTLVIKLNATDLDESTNAEIMYSLSDLTPSKVLELFNMDSQTGEITVKGIIDFEEAKNYEIIVEAKDKGPFALPVHCTVLIDVKDVNDNPPDMILMSVSNSVREDVHYGTVIALISVTDQDFGDNGLTSCLIPPNLPFGLKSTFKNSYTVVINHVLDRETVSEYHIDISCHDSGFPPLSTNKTIQVQVSDVNDNPPRFVDKVHTAYVMENNAFGASICSVSAFDPDLGPNSHLSYSVLDSQLQDMPISSYVSINSENGIIFSQRSFDYEQLKNFQVYVHVQDAGLPPLSTNHTVNVIILDQNDNAPVIVFPLTKNGSQVTIPRSADPEYLVVKVIAVDADSGQNARLFYQLLRATNQNLFTMRTNSGEVRTTRQIEDKDAAIQMMVILVKDNGHPPLSTTITITLSIVDSAEDVVHAVTFMPRMPEHPSSAALYIIISLGAITLTLMLALIALVITICRSASSDEDWCWCFEPSDSGAIYQNSNLNFHTVPDSSLIKNVTEVRGSGSLAQTYCYTLRSAPASVKSDSKFLPHLNAASVRHQSDATDRYFSEWNEKEMDNATILATEVGQLNTDWRSSEPHIVGKISSQCLEENMTQDEVKREFNRRHTAITSAADVDYIKASPDLEDGIPTWAPRFGSQHLEHMEPDEYQPNIYMGGTPVMLSSKQDQVAKQDGQHSASSTKKKKKRSKRSEKRESKATNEEPQNE
ncbi:protocadherin alpha-C2-like isoform X3 [Heptranchias perlo]|uniref:protocadherin alpha-C2-like isoform X3 n=1 Tax=Heptranchias perlo TaxID=212740 RepID=UPI00355A8086